MKHNIEILLDCPNCGNQDIFGVDETIYNHPCYACMIGNFGENAFYHYMNPIKIIQSIEVDFDSTEEIVYIPSKPKYLTLKYDSEHEKYCEICNKCEYFCVKAKDGYCSDFYNICPTTCSECESSTKNKLQFLKKYHFSYDEVWNFDQTIATFILDRLKYFKENTCGFPHIGDIKTFDDWQRALRYMIAFFRIIKKERFIYNNELAVSKMFKNVKENGKKYFSDCFESLWD
jgi:hypothetical protein